MKERRRKKCMSHGIPFSRSLLTLKFATWYMRLHFDTICQLFVVSEQCLNQIRKITLVILILS